MAYGRVVIYRFKPEAIDEIIRKAAEGVVPLYQAQPGFLAYDLIQTSDEEAISVSTWESPEHAEQADGAVAGWLRENLAHAIVSADRRMGHVIAATSARH